jgi:hypothetical protein
MWLPEDAAARDYAKRLISEMKEGEGHDPSLTMVLKGPAQCFSLYNSKYFPATGERRANSV